MPFRVCNISDSAEMSRAQTEKERDMAKNERSEERPRTPQELLEDWTSTVINDLFDRFENSAYRGIPLRGISLVHNTTEGKRTVSVNFLFKDNTEDR